MVSLKTQFVGNVTCQNYNSEGHSYNGQGSGKLYGDTVNPSNKGTEHTNCNGKQSKEMDIWINRDKTLPVVQILK